MLGVVGNSISWIFAPIGLGDWRATVASIAAFLAKEDAVGVLAMLAGAAEDAEEAQVMESLSKLMPPMAAFSYMILNLFDPPCLVAMATCYREMGSRKWGLFAIAFQAILGYSLAFVFYNLGSWYIGNVPFGPMQGIALFYWKEQATQKRKRLLFHGFMCLWLRNSESCCRATRLPLPHSARSASFALLVRQTGALTGCPANAQ